MITDESRWTILGPAGSRHSWCKCSCGVEKRVRTYIVTTKRSRSCGCLRAEINSRAHTPERIAIQKKKALHNFLSWRARNLDRSREINREYAARHPDRRRNARLKSLYGITLRDLEKMIEAQNGVCAICSEPPGKKPLCVDHCHVTERVRGLLCDRCNLMLGRIRDSPTILDAASGYLRKHLAQAKMLNA